MKKFPLLLICFLTIFACTRVEKSTDIIKTFELVEGFQIELMTMEPLIADPVDMVIDEMGRWYVVEMHGYPLDLSGSGKVKRLLDTDGDGIPDESQIFADSLVLPTGIMRWKQGFLVTDPPNVIYLEDTDEDGRADIKEIILTGFARSNPQHNVNNPEYGIDNWIYVAHEGAVSSKNYDELLGDRGSSVHYPNKPNTASLPQNANGLFVRFRPDQGLVEMGSARGQFGQAFDPWGHHFLTSNASHLWHVVMDAKYMGRNEHLLIPTGRNYIPTSRGFEIFPITKNPNHQLLTDVGTLTSACGIMWYKGGLFPSSYENVVFTAEPVHNLIHTDIINESGATFKAVNQFEDHEFLASTDSWFRPVNHYVGPDGAIYVVDYYRKIIEHPEWLSDEVINSGDLYAGVDQGRIYRIKPKGTSVPKFLDNLDLNALTTIELIDLLNNQNSWYRSHAQRLLVDRNDEEISNLLVKAMEDKLNSTGKIHGLYILNGKNALSDDLLNNLLKDSEPGLRENAIKIAEDRLAESPDLVAALISMLNDENAKVRYQLLLTLGELNTPAAEKARDELLMKDIEDEWVQLAALSTKFVNVSSLIDEAETTLQNKQSANTSLFFRRLSELIARSGNPSEVNDFITRILTAKGDIWYLPILLDGITRTASKTQVSNKNKQLLVGKFNKESNPEIRTKSIDLLEEIDYFDDAENTLFIKALERTKQGQQDPDFLSDALKVIAMTDVDDQTSLFTSYFTTDVDPKIRNSAIDAFKYVKDKSLLSKLIDHWAQLLPDERVRAVQIFMNSNDGRRLILSSVASGKMQTTSLSWPNTVQLLNSREDDIRSDARRILKGNELGADSIWNQYKAALAIDGNADNGQTVFKQVCGTCHQKGGENGIAFGPDLASVQNRSHSALLLDILEPNRSIADGFELWQLELNTGNSMTGIISNEGPSTLTIRDASGKEQTINRTDIKNLIAFETSAMPQNLQTQISIDQMADLLAYLKNN
ncbi:MAG: PVC-type heme-binding CxxCH protein [Bacteroidota bacterium]